MTSVSMFEARTNLSKYVNMIVTKQESAIIMRNGIQVAKLVPCDDDTGKRLGVAKGKIPLLESVDEFNSIDLQTEFSGSGGLL